MKEGFGGVNGKIDGLHRRIDAEVDHRIQFDIRVQKVEEKVFPKLVS